MTENRKFMQCPSFREGMAQSDQQKGVTPPPWGFVKEGEKFTISVPAVPPVDSYAKLLDIRRSVRKYADVPMTQGALAFYLWSTQGVQHTRGDVATFRPVPSGGARHPFETYLAIRAVEGLAPGLYYYSPADNIGEKTVTLTRIGELPSAEKVTESLAGQSWTEGAPVIAYYSCVPYKAEWRYVHMAHRVMLIDLGHLGQNAMLSAAALGLGSCCMAAYDQAVSDEIFGLDGENEYVVYAISLGQEDAA
jgi:SagB-type dehydrogenase family enzyme